MSDNFEEGMVLPGVSGQFGGCFFDTLGVE